MKKLTSPLLILASRSPRRIELLKQAGFDFEIQPVSVDETPKTGEAPHDFVKRMAREKAMKAARSQKKTAVILAADTIAVLENQILGKPKNQQEAILMLKKLSGSCHKILTSWILVKSPREILHQETEITKVWFKKLSEEQIQNYVATKKPFDKSGSYSIQDETDGFVKKIAGSFTNVTGLPIEKVVPYLKRI